MENWINKTIKEGKAFLRSNFKKGSSCPCCGQFVKLYSRKLNNSQVRGLINLYNLDLKATNEFFHVRTITSDVNLTGDFAKLVYWKMIEEKSNEDSTKKNSGYWKITELGRRFLRNEIKVPSHILLFDSKFQGYGEKSTDVKQALGEKFNYEELMKT